MLFRFGFFALCSTLLTAQQSVIDIGISSTRFPAGCYIAIDMKLSYSVIDIDKMRKENRTSFSPDDTVHKQFSSDAHSWTISYNGDVIKYGKLPTEASFRFSPPIKKLANVVGMINAEGKVQISYQGKVKDVPFRIGRLYEKDIKYCLYINYSGIKNEEIAYNARLVTMPELETLLKTQSESNSPKLFNITIKNPNSGNPQNMTDEILKTLPPLDNKDEQYKIEITTHGK